LDGFPVNASGKLDRKALPEPEIGSSTTEYIAPRTTAEQSVAAVFAEVLGVDQVGAGDSFFDLGGNSLSATRLVARLRERTGVNVALRELFDSPTVDALATMIDVRGESVDTSAPMPALAPRARPERIPLSPAQQRVWFLNQYDTTSPVHNLPLAVRFTGDLDVAALEVALSDVLRRHESLRTVFPESDSGPSQQVLSVDAATVTLDVVTAADPSAAVREFVLRGFDVTGELPVRARLFRTGADEHVLAIVLHHIAADGWSFAPLARDVMVAYAARAEGVTPAWEPLPVQYPDYTLWQHDVLGDEDDAESRSSRQIDYWRTALADLPDSIDLPSDRPRPAVASKRGATFSVEIPAEVHASMQSLARGRGASTFMVAHAALSVLLSRLTAGEDIAVGTPVAGRGDRALDDLVGMFVNTLVLRARVDPATPFTELLDQVRATDLDAFSHADIPFERLVEVLAPVRSTAHTPLFQVALFFQNHAPAEFTLPGLTVSTMPVLPDVAAFDLQVVLSELDTSEPRSHGSGAGSVTAEFNYATDLFDESTVRELARQFVRVLEVATTNPSVSVGDIELVDRAARDAALARWNDTARDVTPSTLPELFAAQVARTPDATALIAGDRTLSYAEFDAASNRLAHYLIGRGVGPESRVAVLMRRSLDLVVAMYAVVKTGAAYVPVDPDHPSDRVGYVLDSAAPACVLSTFDDRVEVAGDVVEIDLLDLSAFGDEPVTDADRLAPLRADNAAYVIYTSGSTGKPKGVAVTHRAIVNQLAWIQSEYRLTPADVYLQKTATTFDVSVWGYFWPHQVGSTVVLATADGHRDPEYLARTIDRFGVTATDFVPSMLDVFVAEAPESTCATLRHVLVIGEALPPRTAELFRERWAAGLHNLYGPTEAAVSVTYWETTEADTVTVPIGVPEWNTRLYVLDSRLHPVPVGVPGELYLGGVQLARGYLGRVDLTSDRFVADPHGDPGTRMYRTGDLVRRRSDGALEYIGRTDFQVKFRGQRIELGEIEAVLRAHPAVTGAAVLVHSDDATGDHLVAYVVAGSSVTPAELRTHAGEKLPVYMLPSVVTVLDEFPLNASGKLDRKALPAPEFSAETAEYVAPRTDAEHAVAEVFAEVLGLERIGAEDSFFDLGGNSLSATRVVARVRAQFGAEFAVRDLFENPTVAAVAAAAGQPSTGPGDSARPVLARRDRPEVLPLSAAQQRMWFLNRLDPESAAYNLPFGVRFTGDLNVEALSTAVSDVLARHESLRTVYPEIDGEARQLILDAGSITPVSPVQTVTESELSSALVGLFSVGFDVTSEVPVRVRVF
ncbi:amino acid adenylation domain-containing protein, partial [Rhodococcus triatomae]